MPSTCAGAQCKQGHGTKLRACQFQALVRRPSMQEPASKKLKAPHIFVSQLICPCYSAHFAPNHTTEQSVMMSNGKHSGACISATNLSLAGVQDCSEGRRQVRVLTCLRPSRQRRGGKSLAGSPSCRAGHTGHACSRQPGRCLSLSIAEQNALRRTLVITFLELTTVGTGTEAQLCFLCWRHGRTCV